VHWLSNITAVAATAFLLGILTHAYRADRADRTARTAHDRGGPAGSETTCPSCLRPPGRDGRPAGPPLSCGHRAPSPSMHHPAFELVDVWCRRCRSWERVA